MINKKKNLIANYMLPKKHHNEITAIAITKNLSYGQLMRTVVKSYIQGQKNPSLQDKLINAQVGAVSEQKQLIKNMEALIKSLKKEIRI